MIILTETWLEDDQNVEIYKLPHYDVSFNNGGRGKGITTYYNNKLTHKTSIKEEGFSITMLEGEKIDIIGVYRSQDGDENKLLENLEAIINSSKTTIVGGDMNLCIISSPDNYVTKQMRCKGFTQLVNKATHIEGGLIDHVYIRTHEDCNYSWSIEDYPK